MKKYLIIIFVILTLISLFIGSYAISPLKLFSLSDVEKNIFIYSRIPRVISVIVTGAGMSICGLIMQQLTRNKFVSPSTAVTVDATKMGLLLAMVAFPSIGMLGRMTFAFIFGFAGTILFVFLLKKIKIKNVIFIPLLGIMLGNLIDSVTTFFAYRFDAIQVLNNYMVGNFSLVIKGRYELLYIGIPLVIIAYLYANQFTVAGMGEDFAKNLGLNFNLVVNMGLIIVSLITASVIITVGSIPFLGLIIPNIISIYRGDHIKETLFDTALLGANFLLLCDIISRVVISPYEISIGLTVGVIGSLIFLILLFRRLAHGE